ncbi:MAG: hypothetical protein ACE5IR_26830 [bacterium]
MSILEGFKKNWFNSLALFLGLVLVANLFGGFTKLHLFWKNKTDKSLVTDVEKWQTWLNQNSALFESLTDGAQIGITKNRDSDYGVIWTKQKGGIDVRRTNQLRKIGPGIILEFDDQVAKDLQWKKNKDEAIIFLRHRSRIGKIQTYYLKKQEKLQSEGFLNFLRDIGLRPL